MGLQIAHLPVCTETTQTTCSLSVKACMKPDSLPESKRLSLTPPFRRCRPAILNRHSQGDTFQRRDLAFVPRRTGFIICLLYLYFLYLLSIVFSNLHMTMNSAIDKNKVKVAINWIKSLANGINPIDGSVLSDKDIVNNVHISRCLFYVAELLDEAGKKESSSAKQYEMDFNLTTESLSRIYITEKTSISVFVKGINKVIPNNMKPLSVSSVTKWLVQNGYLDVVMKSDGHKTKIPTNLGKSIGISSESRIGSNGEYTAVTYDANAQRFILEILSKE